MPNVVTNVTTGKPKTGGAVFRAPAGTTLPVDAVAELAEGFVCLGYCSEDGLTNANGLSSEAIKAWGGDTVLITETDHSDTFSLTLIEGLNADVLKTIYGEGNVTGDLATGLKVTVNTEAHEDYVWVVDMVMRGGVLKRVVIPQGRVSEIAEITYSDSSAVGYGITITAQNDTTGTSHYEYFKDATVAGG